MMKHTLPQCYKFQNAQKLAKEEVVQKRKGKCAKASGSESKETAQIAANVSPHPAALQTPVTDFSWNADASSIINAFPIEEGNIGAKELSNGHIYIDLYLFNIMSCDSMLPINRTLNLTLSPYHNTASMDNATVITIVVVFSLLILVFPLCQFINWFWCFNYFYPPPDNVLNEYWAYQLELLSSTPDTSDTNANEDANERAVRFALPPVPPPVHNRCTRVRKHTHHRRTILPLDFNHSLTSSLTEDNHDKDTAQEAKGEGDGIEYVERVAEFAGKASLLNDLSGPLQFATNFDWNADTRATSHTTPHRNFLYDYTTLSIPIRLADGTVVYSEVLVIWYLIRL
jgi:hypothetical protein